MNKTAIKNFAIWARNKLIADITYKAGLLGVTEQEIKTALPQSTKDVQFFDIGTKEPYSISGIEIKQREKLAETINNKAKQSDYATAYKAVVEEVAYTWFNRLIAVRFMEVNDYLPSRIRVLSSESKTKIEPDLVTTPFDANLHYTPYEKDRIMQLIHENRLDELFQMLFIKQCNALNDILPNLFEKTSDYTELLLNVSFTDKDGVVYRLVHDIPEDDFDVKREGQVEIIGWLYQYYNTELKDEAFALLKKNVKITKERIPAVTQLFTPDWIVRYMVENSLGRLWIERERASSGVSGEYLNGSYFGWKYYLEETEQESDVEAQLAKIREDYKTIKPEDIKVIDPCMGSGHILVYAFDVLMQIYESYGYSQRNAATSIVENNLFGLDIDNRAYQLAYFAIMMKARQYNRRILDGETDCHVYSIQESNGINRNHLKYFGAGMSEIERNTAMLQLQGLLDTFIDAKEYGSILNVENYNWEMLYRFTSNIDIGGQMTLDAIDIEETKDQLYTLVEIGKVMAQKYDVVVTNPPYMGISNGNGKLSDYVKIYYPDSKADLFAVFIEKCGQMVNKNRYQAMITQHAWMFLTSFEKLRRRLQFVDFINMVHLGARAFEEIGGEVVQTTSFVIRKSNISNFRACYFRLIEYNSQMAKQEAFIARREMYISHKENFSKIPGMPIAYWMSDKTIMPFESGKSLDKVAFVKAGLTTANNDMFLRLWFELKNDEIEFNQHPNKELSLKKWFITNKGGGFRKWYGNDEYVMDWQNNGDRVRKAPGATIRNSNYYFKECITWSNVSTAKPAFRYKAIGFIPNATGPSIYFKDLSIKYIMGACNSKYVEIILALLAPTIHFEVGQVSNIPIIIKDEYIQHVEEKVDINISLSKKDWDSFETSWNFIRHPLIRSCSTISNAFEEWNQETINRFNELKGSEEELNRIFIDIYGLENELTPEVEDKDITIRKADIGRDIRSFISYAIGCMFGRYSLDVDGLAYAGGKFSVKSEEWSVKCNPPYVEYEGKLYHRSNFTLNSPNSTLNKFCPDKDNILPITDEEYFEDDIVGLFVTFVKKVYGEETLEQNLDFIAKALGNKGNSSREIIRNYFLRDFFKDHCKIYQKRPIYWLFDSGKADGFKALIYLHRYDENTIGNLRIDYLHRMQRVYESEIARMQDTIDKSTNAREVTLAEKRKEKLIKQLKETKEYDEKIAHLALARIAIDLDDGVRVNYEKVQTDADGKKLDVLAKI